MDRSHRGQPAAIVHATPTYQLLDPLAADDVSTVARLHCAAPLDWDPDHTYSDSMLEKVASRLSGSDGSINFVMLARNEADNIIAFHWVQAKPGEDKPHAHVVGLWVQFEYRKQGIAARLKSLGEAWCMEQGITELRTNVYTVNEAMVEFNRRRGFEVAMLGMVKKLD